MDTIVVDILAMLFDDVASRDNNNGSSRCTVQSSFFNKAPTAERLVESPWTAAVMAVCPVSARRSLSRTLRSSVGRKSSGASTACGTTWRRSPGRSARTCAPSSSCSARHRSVSTAAVRVQVRFSTNDLHRTSNAFGCVYLGTKFGIEILFSEVCCELRGPLIP